MIRKLPDPLKSKPVVVAVVVVVFVAVVVVTGSTEK